MKAARATTAAACATRWPSTSSLFEKPTPKRQKKARLELEFFLLRRSGILIPTFNARAERGSVSMIPLGRSCIHPVPGSARQLRPSEIKGAAQQRHRFRINEWYSGLPATAREN